LTEIVDYLPQDLKEEILQKALVATKSIQHEEDCLSALRSLIHKLSPNLVSEALAIGEALSSELNRVRAITEIVDYLPQDTTEEVLQKALDSARGVEEEWCRSISLADLAPKLPEALQVEIWQEALTAVRDEEDWQALIFQRRFCLQATLEKLHESKTPVSMYKKRSFRQDKEENE
jgi:hypothetical protein